MPDNKFLDRYPHQEDIDALSGLTGGLDLGSKHSSEVPKLLITSSKKQIAQLTQTLMENYIFKTMNDTKEIFYYDEQNGIFVKYGECIIESQAESAFPSISTKEVNEVINHIRRRTLTDRFEFDSQIEWLACKNCMINLKTLETRPHSPEFMTTMMIPVSYNCEHSFESVSNNKNCCPCPAIMKFMHEVMAAEDMETVLDFIAYCLWRAFPHHRYLLFSGSGRNGKGVMLEVIKRLLGHQNVSGESLHRLLYNRFAPAELHGKLANIDADLSKEALKNTGTLKKLTGGDYIPAEKKFLEPFKFVNSAKLLFSANEIPQTPDETDAFFARLIIINFPNQFLGDKADPYLIDRLTKAEELSGLFNIVVRRLPKVLNKGIYVSSSTIDENYSKYIQSSNPVRAFVEAALKRDNDSTSIKDEVFEAYKT
jgi:P4 family phage/plasmid primase-like protien